MRAATAAMSRRHQPRPRKSLIRLSPSSPSAAIARLRSAKARICASEIVACAIRLSSTRSRVGSTAAPLRPPPVRKRAANAGRRRIAPGRSAWRCASPPKDRRAASATPSVSHRAHRDRPSPPVQRPIQTPARIVSAAAAPYARDIAVRKFPSLPPCRCFAAAACCTLQNICNIATCRIAQ